MKKVAVLQSNYIPWKGYFEIIKEVDEFIIYDDVQYTKNDWRNRNKILSREGLQWLTIPVKQKTIHQKINETEISRFNWNKKHWQSLVTNYAKSPFFKETSNVLKSFYESIDSFNLSEINIFFIKKICDILLIDTKISLCSDYSYDRSLHKENRLLSLLNASNASEYISGPAAKDYMNEDSFIKENIQIHWMTYGPYKRYDQLHSYNNFENNVSIIDVLFNVGLKNSYKYIKSIRESL